MNASSGKPAHAEDFIREPIFAGVPGWVAIVYLAPMTVTKPL